MGKQESHDVQQRQPQSPGDEQPQVPAQAGGGPATKQLPRKGPGVNNTDILAFYHCLHRAGRERKVHVLLDCLVRTPRAGSRTL